MTLGQRLTTVVDKTALDYSHIARILDTNPRTVSRWASEETEPRWESRERLLELLAVIERLQQVVDKRAIPDWLFAPTPALSFEKPVELIRRGEFRRVLGLVDALGEGVFS